MSKKIKLLMLSFLCIVLLGLQTNYVKAQTYELTYSTFFPPASSMGKLAKEWCEEVEKRTDGKVKVSFFPGETLTSADQCYDGVIQGRSDVGMSCLVYTRGRFPLMSFVNLPLGYPNAKFATAIINEVYEKYKPKGLSDTKVQYLFAHGPGFINTKGKPIKTLEDFKGMKLRTPGAVANLVKALGGKPVGMTQPEVYQALQRGVVDGVLAPSEAIETWNYDEVTDYTTACYDIAYSIGFFVTMNKKTWNKLPQDIQNTINEINKEWILKTAKTWDKSDFKGIQTQLRAGNEIIGIGPEESKKWKEAVQPVFETYIEKTKDRNVPGKEVLKYVRKRLDQYKKGNFKSEFID